MGDLENKKDPKAEKENREKIDSLRGIIEEAEKSLYSARAMLMRMEGDSKPGYIKKTYGASPNGKIIEGIFDGQIMIGNDGKQYPVPANYASKSKLVEGDMLKLTITDDGNFIYKQIGPVDRKRLIGIVREDESGNFVVEAEGHSYRVLLASVTYYKAQPGDEVTIVIPKSGEPTWGSIENVTKKAFEIGGESAGGVEGATEYSEEQDPFLKREADSEIREEKPEEAAGVKTDQKGVIEEWTPKLSQIEKEAEEIEKNVRSQEKNDDNGGLNEEEDDNDNTEQNAYGGDSDSDEKVAIKVGGEREEDSVVKKEFPDTPDEFFSAKI